MWPVMLAVRSNLPLPMNCTRKRTDAGSGDDAADDAVVLEVSAAFVTVADAPDAREAPEVRVATIIVAPASPMSAPRLERGRLVRARRRITGMRQCAHPTLDLAWTSLGPVSDLAQAVGMVVPGACTDARSYASHKGSGRSTDRPRSASSP